MNMLKRFPKTVCKLIQTKHRQNINEKSRQLFLYLQWVGTHFILCEGAKRPFRILILTQETFLIQKSFYFPENFDKRLTWIALRRSPPLYY